MVEAMEVQKGYKQTEVGVIPSGWAVNKVDDFAIKVGSGITPTGGERVYKKEGRPFLRSQNVGWGNLILDDVAFIDDYTHNSFNSTEIQENDVFLNITGASIGRSSIADKRVVKGNVNQHVCIIRVDINKTEPRYLNYCLLSSLGQKQITNFQAGGNRQGLNFGQIRSILIPLPPTKAEQTAIATALNDADALITQLEKLIAKKRAIKQGAMQELLNPMVNCELRMENGEKNSQFTTHNSPFLKAGWEVKKLGEIADIRRGASPRPIKDPKWFSDSGRGWIRISDVTSSNVYLNSTTQYLSEDGARNSVAVNRGDLIMSICATIGIPIIINIPACIHDGFVLFKNYEKELDTFFLYFSLQVKTEILTGKGQPGTQKNLNTTIVGDIEIDYPDVDEQRKIGLILRDIDIEISGLEKKLGSPYKTVQVNNFKQLALSCCE